MGDHLKPPTTFGPYRKGILAALGVLAQVAATATLPPELEPWAPVVIALAVALGVYAVPNEETYRG